MNATNQISTDDVAEGHSFADQIGQLVTSKYQALFGTTTYSKRRVMAGIVISRGDGDISACGEVICVSSGTKCINGEQEWSSKFYLFVLATHFGDQSLLSS